MCCNVTDLTEKLSDYWTLPVCMLFLIVICIVGLFSTTCLLHGVRKLLNSPDAAGYLYIVLSYALCDLFYCCIFPPIWILGWMYKKTNFTLFALRNALFLLFVILSQLHYLSHLIDKFWQIVAPFHYHRLVQRKHIIVLVVCNWTGN